MNRPRTRPEVAPSSGEVRQLGKPKPGLLVILALLYALVVQIGLGGFSTGARAAAPGGLPAQTLLCQPGKTTDVPASQTPDHDRHDGTCCLAACASRLSAGPPPATGVLPAFQPAVALVPASQPGEVPFALAPALHPLCARGPPLKA